VTFSDWNLPGWKLRSDLPTASIRNDPTSRNGTMVVIPLPDVEIRTPASDSPVEGSRTARFRVVSEEVSSREIKLTVEGLCGSRADLTVMRHKLVQPRLKVAPGVSIDDDESNPEAKGPAVTLSFLDTAHEDPKIPERLSFHFPPGVGWQTITVTLTW
jgi:hypothetical protein